MALWDEKDPRWQVEHREDGKNVNNWHWTSTSKLQWAKERLGELFKSLNADVEPDVASLSITGVKQVAGEASVTLRKGNKKLVLFDLAITLDYEGKVAGSDKVIKGELKVEEVANASEEDDFIFTITVEGSGSEQDQCKKIAEGMKPIVLKHLQTFIEELNEL